MTAKKLDGRSIKYQDRKWLLKNHKGELMSRYATEQAARKAEKEYNKHMPVNMRCTIVRELE